MMRGLMVAGPRSSLGDAAQIKNADIKNVSRLGGIARAAGFPVGSTAVDSSKSRPSRDADRSAGSTDSSRSKDRDRAARFDPTATLAARFRGVRYLIRQRTFGPRACLRKNRAVLDPER